MSSSYLWKRPLRGRLACVLAAILSLVVRTGRSEETVAFNRDIRPIFAKHCTACHGGVKAAGELSLVYRDKALSVIEPGEPENSELIRRVMSTDPEEVMPKPEHGPRLSDQDIATLTTWIKEGAAWSEHWSFVKPQDVPAPAVKDATWPRNTADRFILARLEAANRTPSAPAAPAEWLRRVSLDLIGLPPTIEQWQQFQQQWAVDPAAAREAVVGELLRSPHFGERWAAMWLDLARYSDTFGYEKDPHRDIWPWRDWVIRALNADMPFDQFTIKQLAGDLLADPQPDDLLATAFHRNTQCNTEGGTDDEEFRTSAVVDRVNTTWVAWQATTFGCVRCHSHPYDPYAQESYYRFLALFNNTEDCDQNDDFPRTRVANEGERQADVVRLETELRRLRQELNRTGIALAARTRDWQPLVPLELKSSGGNLAHDDTGRTTATGTLPIGVFYTVIFPASPATAFRLQVFPDSDDPARWPERGSVLSKIEATLMLADGQRQSVQLKEVVADHIDGPFDPQTSLDDDAGGFGGFPVLRGPRWAVVVPEAPLAPPEGSRLELVMRQSAASNSGFQACTIRRFRWESSTDAQWTQWAADELRARQWEEWRQKTAELAAIPATLVPVMRELADEARRETRVFIRGNFLTKGDPVEPGLPEVFHAAAPSEGRPLNRLDMARWLVSDGNPLAARVLANRLWSELFGRGLVETLEDFGTSGLPPSHPELLDHLALRLARDQHWSVKQFLRELVLSATYGQTARQAKEGYEQDPANQLYGRGPRVRLTSEMVRDQALVVSGMFSPKQFGPPVFPPQPEGVWSTVYSGATWNTSTGEDRYRRAIYTYCRRTSGYPALLTFDAPSRDVCTARRVPTNTPLQALVTLNDPAFVELAQGFAKRMEEGGGATADKLSRGYRLLLLEDPAGEILDVLVRLHDEALEEYRQAPADASRMAETPELAALILIANTLLNMDAALVR